MARPETLFLSAVLTIASDTGMTPTKRMIKRLVNNNVSEQSVQGLLVPLQKRQNSRQNPAIVSCPCLCLDQLTFEIHQAHLRRYLQCPFPRLHGAKQCLSCLETSFRPAM